MCCGMITNAAYAVHLIEMEYFMGSLSMWLQIIRLSFLDTDDF